jgi:prolyl-tRNA editing enzyme YbaK/EbsC (Cys-tRNA(Pro) deacylase)
MQAQVIRDYLAQQAPDLRIVDLQEAHTTDYISREWNVLPAQVAKTLTLRVGGDVKIVVTCADSRLDNRKVKEVLGGKGSMVPGHPVGGITPLCLAAPLPVFFDVQLQRFDEVVTAAGATHSAIRIPPRRFAELVDAIWVDICTQP